MSEHIAGQSVMIYVFMLFSSAYTLIEQLASYIPILKGDILRLSGHQVDSTDGQLSDQS